MNESKRHHYVPRMLLRNFVDQNGLLYFFDKRMAEKQVRKTTPDNFCVECNLYTWYDEQKGKNISAERVFAALEGRAAEVIKKIIKTARDGKKPRLTRSEKETWDQFLHCQWGRVPEQIDPYMNNYEEYSLEAMKKVEKTLGPITQETLKKISSPEYKRRFKKEIRARTLSSAVTNYDKAILRCFGDKGLAIAIIRKPKKSFLIGSRPVLRLSYPEKPHLSDPSVEAWLPIARDIAIVPSFSRNVERLIEVRDPTIRSVNEMIFKQSLAIAGCSKELVKSIARA